MKKKPCRHKWGHFTDFRVALKNGKKVIGFVTVDWCAKCGTEKIIPRKTS